MKRRAFLCFFSFLMWIEPVYPQTTNEGKKEDKPRPRKHPKPKEDKDKAKKK